MLKIRSFHQFTLEILYSQFLGPLTKLTTPIFDHTHSTQKFLDQLLIYVNFYLYAKNQAISLI